jgi:hypothetical protein
MSVTSLWITAIRANTWFPFGWWSFMYKTASTFSHIDLTICGSSLPGILNSACAADQVPSSYRGVIVCSLVDWSLALSSVYFMIQRLWSLNVQYLKTLCIDWCLLLQI